MINRKTRRENEKLECLGEDSEAEAGGVGREQAEENAGGGGFLDGGGSPLAVLDLEKAGDGVDAGGGRESLFG